MKTKLVVAGGLLLLITQFQTFAQGSLTPPGAPAPTMKTLDQIEPRTPISSLPLTITGAGSYYLTTNLTGVSGQYGLTISCGNVTVDLNGFTLLGVSGSLSGIYFAGTYTNVTVRDGTITGWSESGVDSYSAGYPRNMVFENLTVSANGGYGIETEADSIVRDCLAMSNHLDGIFSEGGEISHCLARENANAGIHGNGCIVRDCEAEYNVNYGFNFFQSSAKDCVSKFNGTLSTSDGFYIVQSSMAGCQSQNNAGAAVYCSGSENEVRDCTVYSNGSGGIVLSGSALAADNHIINNNGYGILVAAIGCQIIGNTCVSNADPAIFVLTADNRIDNNNVFTTSGFSGISVVNTGSTNNIVTRNTVIGNGASGFSFVAGNDVGPIGSLSTNMSPWANVTH